MELKLFPMLNLKQICNFTSIKSTIMEKRLAKKNKKIFRVCGGLGDYFDIDPTIIRALFLISVIVFGTGLLIYIILALVMPEEGIIN